jgi:hypothetical protein
MDEISTLVTEVDDTITLISESDEALISNNRFITNNSSKKTPSSLFKSFLRPLSSEISNSFNSETEDVFHSPHRIGILDNDPNPKEIVTSRCMKGQESTNIDTFDSNNFCARIDNYHSTFTRHDSSSEKNRRSGESTLPSSKLSIRLSSRSRSSDSLLIDTTSCLPFVSIHEPTSFKNIHNSSQSICASTSSSTSAANSLLSIDRILPYKSAGRSYSIDEQKSFKYSNSDKVRPSISSSLPDELKLLRMKSFGERIRSERTTLYKDPSSSSNEFNKLKLFKKNLSKNHISEMSVVTLPNILPNILCTNDGRVRRPREAGGQTTKDS